MRVFEFGFGPLPVGDLTRQHDVGILEFGVFFLQRTLNALLFIQGILETAHQDGQRERCHHVQQKKIGTDDPPFGHHVRGHKFKGVKFDGDHEAETENGQAVEQQAH